MKRTKWFERTFSPVTDNGLLPYLLERLQGTPARLEELMEEAAPALLEVKPEGRWSLKEEVGHLGDLEPLWSVRVDNLINGEAVMMAADLTNARTYQAGHNSNDIGILLQRFRKERELLLLKIRKMTDEQLEHTSMHPRLKAPMRLADLVYFVAEHDDHHLAEARELISLMKTERL